MREAQTTLIPAAKRYERPGEPPFAGDAAPERARLAAASAAAAVAARHLSAARAAADAALAD